MNKNNQEGSREVKERREKKRMKRVRTEWQRDKALTHSLIFKLQCLQVIPSANVWRFGGSSLGTTFSPL